MPEGRKRSWATAVFFLLTVGVSILFVLAYSKYLLSNQSLNAETGQRLAENYRSAETFAERLQAGGEALLAAGTEEERLRAAALAGEAVMASKGTALLFAEVSGRTGGPKGDEAVAEAEDRLNAIVGDNGIVRTVSLRAEAPSEEEKATLTAIVEAAAEMKAALGGFMEPSGTAGYRQMATDDSWIGPVKAAIAALERVSPK